MSTLTHSLSCHLSRVVVVGVVPNPILIQSWILVTKKIPKEQLELHPPPMVDGAYILVAPSMTPPPRSLVVLILCISSSWSWSPRPSRREALLSAASWIASSSSASAICNPGDASPDCIGVYKLPSSTGSITTPDARLVLEAQRRAADDIRQVVAAGRLEEAGIKVLNLLPKVTAAGQTLLQTELVSHGGSDGISEVRRIQVQSQLEEMLASWNRCDVTIGQGLRGDLGVSAVAQLTVLSELREATNAMDEFLSLVGQN